MKELLTYPGYPTKRLTIEDIDETTNLTLPDGEWSTGVFIYPTLEHQEKLRVQGYELDDFGRPLHPWLRDMLLEPNVGVVTGLGEYWHWGPNRTADPIVINNDAEPKILLIQRKDIGSWALPGGFIDADESAADAARRELFEEAGLKVAGDPHEVYKGAVADARTTAHAWAETAALLWRVDGTPNLSPNYDEVLDAQWFPVDRLPDFVHGSHAIIIEKAVKELRKMNLDKSTETQVQGGHMLYRRVLVTSPDGSKKFVKHHDQKAFTDPIREQHSRQYLHKEKKMYDHVTKHGFEHVPKSIELIDGHTLTMEALDEEDGWHWRAPAENIDQYIQDVFAAIDSLESTPLPDNFHDTEKPTNEEFYYLGWGRYDLVNSHRCIQKHLKQWYPDFRNFRKAAEDLAQNTDILHMSARPIEDATVFSHHDLRQANIAWHPEGGVRIVDWSWAGLGPKNADTTMLLIDLHKSGHDVSRHMDRFNHRHAQALIGYWLRQSQLEPRDPDSSVRFQQALSAVSAYDLLMKYGER